MAIRPIILFPDPALSTPSRPITSFGPETTQLITTLWHTLKASPGVGLAAPQIGVLLRAAVIDVSKKEKKHGPFVLINPIITKTSGLQIPREGCLSVPDLLANVKRHQQVTVRYQNELGTTQEMTAEGFEALAIQHEVDHLNGHLFLDRVTNLQTDIFRRKRS